MSFTRKAIGVTLGLGAGQKFANGADTLDLAGLRVSVAITNAVGDYQGALDARIYGMTQSSMNDATRIQGTPYSVGNATVTVTAGDAQSGMLLAYTGSVTDAWTDYSGSPDVAFRVVAFGGATAAAKPAAAASYQGGASVATIMASLAQRMGFVFENNGVEVLVSDPYLPGTVYKQAERLRDMAGIFMVVEHGTLAIWPANSTRSGDIPVIGPGGVVNGVPQPGGLVGYPTITQAGVNFRAEYGAAPLKCGGKVQLKTSVLHAAGTWQIIGIAHNIESETPGGQWFSEVTCVRTGM